MADVFAFLATMVVFVAIIYGIYRIIVWNTKEAPDLEGSPCMGTVQNWDVLVAGKKVALTYQPPSLVPQAGFFGRRQQNDYIILSPGEARQIAQWLRIAAAPGISVAVAQKALARTKDKKVA
jgi:hypothetical protein